MHTIPARRSRRTPRTVFMSGALTCFGLLVTTMGYAVWATYFSGHLVADAPLVPTVPVEQRRGPGELSIPCRSLGPLGLDASMNPLRVTLVARGSFVGYGHEDVLQCLVLDSNGRLVTVLDGPFRAPSMSRGRGRQIRGIPLGEFMLDHHDMYTLVPTFHVWRGLPRASLRLMVRRNVVSANVQVVVAGFAAAFVSLMLGLIGHAAQRRSAEHRAAA